MECEALSRWHAFSNSIHTSTQDNNYKRKGISSSQPGQARSSNEKGRVDWRQCNTSDTVGSDTGKPGGQVPEDKNKYNQSYHHIDEFQRLN
jgi:hypothetical protein